jgi:serine/threonine protein kinase
MPAVAAATVAAPPAFHPPVLPLPLHPLQLLASLSSPHIVRYYDSFLHEGQLYIVMEYAPGGSLHAAISRSPRPLPEDQIWRVLLHTALALHHMHSRWARREPATQCGAALAAGSSCIP